MAESPWQPHVPSGSAGLEIGAWRDRTLVATRRFIDLFKYLLKPRDVFFGLSLVLLERSFELFRLRGFGHLGQGAQDFLFGKIDVLECFVKQFL